MSPLLTVPMISVLVDGCTEHLSKSEPQYQIDLLFIPYVLCKQTNTSESAILISIFLSAIVDEVYIQSLILEAMFQLLTSISA